MTIQENYSIQGEGHSMCAISYFATSSRNETKIKHRTVEYKEKQTNVFSSGDSRTCGMEDVRGDSSWQNKM